MEAHPKKKFFFNNFSAVTKDAWKTRILNDVKAATDEEKQRLYDKQMVWHPYEGFPVEPFYTPEDALHLNLGALKKQPGWRTREWIPVTDESTANQQARDALTMGADEIAFELTKEPVNVPALMHEITAPVRLYVSQPASFPEVPPNGTVVYDWFAASPPIASAMGYLQLPASNLQFSILTSQFHPSPIHELAFGLSALVEYAHQRTEQHIPAETVFGQVETQFVVGTDFLMEMAKLRAWRLLYRQVAGAYGVLEASCDIYAKTRQPPETTEEPANHLIRATIAAMAAVLGGCDALTVLPYTGNAADTSARRISRNVSTILREESFLDKVTDIAAGSYYVDQLTVQLAQRAWQLFQTVEAQGGFLRAMENGFIAEEMGKVQRQ